MNAEFIQALDEIEREKHISKDVLIEAIENSLLTACKNNFGTASNIEVTIDRDSGNVTVVAEKTVVEEVKDKSLELTVEQARDLNPDYALGDLVQEVVTPKNFGRIAAQKAKQVVVQKIREAERNAIYESFLEKEQDLMTGIIQRRVRNNVIINLGQVDAVLTDKEQVAKENYGINNRLKVYVLEVKNTNKGPKVYVSRTHPDLVRRLFENEVPEIHKGVVDIKSISREAGSRTKMAVHSSDPSVDPIGACVGHNGSRVNIVVHELFGEKIDIIPWNEEIEKFISAALSPSKVVKVAVNPADKTAKVIVPDYQLSLAIGKEGQNARLAAKLTGYRIDIKSETQAKETNFIPEKEVEETPALEEKSKISFDPDKITDAMVDELVDELVANELAEAYEEDDFDYDTGKHEVHHIEEMDEDELEALYEDLDANFEEYEAYEEMIHQEEASEDTSEDTSEDADDNDDDDDLFEES